MRRRRWRFGLTGVGIICALAAATGLSGRLAGWLAPERSPVADFPRATVRRADLNAMLTAGGRVESTRQTLIECELEALEIGVRGQRMAGGGASTILSLVPDGATVKEGDVLCRLDASDYEEMARQQKMTVQRARADRRMAALDLDVARMAVREYREGTLLEARKELEGQVAMSRVNLERANDRMAWAARMKKKGYVPASQVMGEELSRARAAFALSQAITARAVFEGFTVPRTLRELESAVLSAEVQLNYQEQRLLIDEERLARLERQVEHCTIRAPHDGFVIYANNEGRPDLQIEEGMTVRQRQKLFYLPDLTKMEVQALVHESVAGRVRVGMFARLQVEGLPNDRIEGHVVSIAHLPAKNFFSDVRYFLTRVQLDTIPRGLLPGMTAEVRVATTHRPDVLAIPPEALAVEAGHDVCYVAREDGLVRRRVTVGEATPELVEVRAGLEEGEQVVLEPEHGMAPIESIGAPEPDGSDANAEAE